jgi:catechol 2,3-dioxygenase-like lactoylglutathione lyase family enzyme
MGRMIGRLDSVVIDCPDPRALADFYCELLGMHVVFDDGDWVTIRTDSDAPSMAFQKATDLVLPQWPDPSRPQQFHLDVKVDDIETAEGRARAAGARRLPGGGETFRVYADPVGRPSASPGDPAAAASRCRSTVSTAPGRSWADKFRRGRLRAAPAPGNVGGGD